MRRLSVVWSVSFLAAMTAAGQLSTSVWSHAQGGSWLHPSNWVNEIVATNKEYADLSAADGGETITLESGTIHLSGVNYSHTNSTLPLYCREKDWASIMGNPSVPFTFDINGTLSWGIPILQQNPTVRKQGNGELILTAAPLHKNATQPVTFRIEEGKVSIKTLNILANAQIKLVGSSILTPQSNFVSRIGSIDTLEIGNGKIDLDYGILSIGGFGDSTITHPVTGTAGRSGLEAIAGSTLTLAANPEVPIKLRARAAQLHIADSVSLDPETELWIAQNGRIQIQGIQTQHTVYANSPRGSISIADGASLTLDGGTNRQSTFLAGFSGTGTLMKRGSNTLTIAAGTLPQTTQIEQGTLQLGNDTPKSVGSTKRLNFTTATSIYSDEKNQLTLRTNGAQWENDPERGGVIRFNGTQSLYQNNVPPGSVLAGDSDYTVGFWFKTPTDSIHQDTRLFWYGINDGTPGRNIQIGFWGAFNQLVVSHYGNDFKIQTSSLLNDNTWHFLTATRRSNVLHVYLDGEKIFTTENVITLKLPDASCLSIGSYQGLTSNQAHRRFDGWIDDVTILPFSISETEVGSLMRGETIIHAFARDTSIVQPVIHYTFDDPNFIGKDSIGSGNDLLLDKSIAGYQFPMETQETLGESIATPFSFPIVDAILTNDLQRGKVAYFDGSTEGISIDATPSGSFVTGKRDFTVALWVKIPEEITKAAFFRYGGTNYGANLLFCITNQKLGLSCRHALLDFLEKGEPLCDNQWHHIVCRFQKSVATFRCDNQTVATFSVEPWNNSLPHWPDGGAMSIGSYDKRADFAFKGWMDDVVILNYALSDDELDRLYKCQNLEAFPVQQCDDDESPTGTRSLRIRELFYAGGENALQMPDPTAAPADLPHPCNNEELSLTFWARQESGAKEEGGALFYWGEGADLYVFHTKTSYMSSGCRDVLRFATIENYSDRGKVVSEFQTSDMLGPTLVNGPKDLRWHHYAIVRTSSQTRFYIDGVQANSYMNGSNTTPNVNFRLGARATGQAFQGALDEMKIFNKALSSQEIIQLIRSEETASTQAQNSTVHVEQGATFVINDKEYTLHDLSGEGNLHLANTALQITGTARMGGTLSGSGSIEVAPGGHLLIPQGLGTFSGDLTITQDATVTIENAAPSYAKIWLEGAGKIEGALSTDVVIPDQAVFQLNGISEPIATTTGTVFIQGSGSVIGTASHVGRRFTLAAGSAIQAESIDQWNVVIEEVPQAYGIFRTENNTFSVTIACPGTLLLLR